MTDFIVGLALGLLVGTNIALWFVAWLGDNGKSD